MFIKPTFLFSTLFLFVTACAEPPSRLSLADPSETTTRTQTVQRLMGNESFLFRAYDYPGKKQVRVQRADDLTHVTLSKKIWAEIMSDEFSSKKPCEKLEANEQRIIAEKKLEELSVILYEIDEEKHKKLIELEASAGKRTSSKCPHIITFNLTNLLNGGKEHIKFAMLLAQSDEQRKIISEAAGKAGIEWYQRVALKSQRIWTRHQFEITGALYTGGFFCADLLLQKMWAYNPYVASGLFATTMTYQLWNSRHWGHVNQSTAALSALGALSLARYKGLLGF